MPPPLLIHPVHQGPFWVKEIGVEPGGTLMLRPRLPYVEGLALRDYTLKLNFPAALKPSPLRIAITDSNNNLVLAQEAFQNAAPIDGQKRLEWRGQPNFSLAGKGTVSVAIAHYWEGMGEYARPVYRGIFSLTGDFDWTKFETTFHTLPDAIYITAEKWWGWEGLTTGDIYFRYFQVQEADTGRVVYEWESDPPQHFKLDGTRHILHRFPDTERYMSRIPVRPNQRYKVIVEAKGVGLKPYTSAAEVLKRGDTLFTRTLVFDVDSDIKLPQPLFWRITDGKGRTYREGQVVLTSLPERVAPRKMDTSVWIAETYLQTEPLPVQELYINTLYRWGLNTIEPFLEEPIFSFNVPLTDAQVAMPIASMAKRLGMRVRPYLKFLYLSSFRYAEAYISAHPEFFVTPVHDIIPCSLILVCHAHMLDGGKYESPPRPDILGGRENPWLGYYLEVVERSVRVNQLDGIFFDWEIAAAPGNIRAHPGQVESYSCVCARCRRAFQAFANLEHTPTPEECAGPLYDRYVDFRCWQNTRIWQLFAQAARVANPQASFAIYSGCPGAYSREVYGVDWDIIAPYIDYAMQRRFYPMSEIAIERALDRGLRPGQTRPPLILQLQVVPYPDMCPWTIPNRYQRLPHLKNNIVQLVARSGSTFGWSFNGIWGMDDQMTLPIREANSILARYEDFFLKGRRVPEVVRVKTGGPAIIANWEKEGKVVTFVFNHGATPREVTLGRDGFADVQLNVPAHDLVVHEW